MQALQLLGVVAGGAIAIKVIVSKKNIQGVMIVLAGAAVMALGLLVMGGWYLDWPEIVQISPRFTPMQYNTALAFLLCGAGLIAARYDYRLITGLCGGGAAALGLLTMVEHLSGGDLGLDEFFFHYQTPIETAEHDHVHPSVLAHPGRMALNTALAFTLSGGALLSFSLKSCIRNITMTRSILALLVSGLGLVAFIGYIARLDAAHGWGDFSHMAVHTAIGFLILGAGLVALTLYRAQASGSRLSWLIPLAVVTAAVIFLLDIALPLGIAAGVPYVMLVLMGLWSPWRPLIIVLAVAATLLTLGGYTISPEGGTPWMVLTNRGLALFAIWATAVLGYLQIFSKETLRKSEERYQLAVQGSNEGIWDWNIPAGEGFHSERWSQLLGYEPGELMDEYETFADLLHPDDRERTLEAIGRHLEERVPYEEEMRLRTKSGEYKWFLERGQALWDEEGRPIRMSGSISEITERKLAEDLSTRMGRILEDSFNEIFFFDAETLCFTQVNRGARENLGYSTEEFALLTPVDIKPEFTHETFAEMLVPLRSGKERLLNFETVHQRKDGSTYDVSVKLQLSSEESPPIFVAIIEDITERKQAEESLLRTNRALKVLSEGNHVLAQATDEQQLLKDICRITVETGGYVFAWVGLAERDKRKSVIPLAHWGVEEGYLETADITWADEERGRGPVGMAIRTGKPSISNDFRTDPDFALWREEALKRGYASDVALPLSIGGQMYGALTIYAPEPDAFDDEEMELLVTLSENLAFGIHVLRGDAERKLAEEALQYSESSLSESQRIAHLGNWDWNIVSNELWWSDEIYRIFGLKVREFEATHKAFLAAVHPDDLKLVQDSVDQALCEGVPYSIDHRIVLPNGEQRVVHEQAEVTVGDDGEPLHMVGTVHDITERKQAEEALRQSEERFSGILELAPEAIISIDEKGFIRLFNRGAEKVFGYDSSEIVGKTVGCLIPEKFRSTHEKLVGEFRDSEESSHLMSRRGEIVGLRKNGEEFPAEASISRLEVSGKIILTVMLHDISQRKRTEEHLHQTQKMEALGNLTGGVAHEFNNLLMAILGNLELMDEDMAGNESVRKRLSLAMESTLRGKSLTQQLLAYSRTGSLHPQLMDLNEAVLRSCRMLNQALVETIEIKTKTGPDPWPVMIDAGELEGVLLNLVLNARDAMPKGGVITIETANRKLTKKDTNKLSDLKPGNYVTISVGDTGCGMPPEVIEHVFDPFFTTKEVGEGTGLGLSMVLGFAKQAGGTAEIESKPGKGTTVRFYLPRAKGKIKPKPRLKKKSAKETQEIPTGTETILYVEDDPVVLMIGLSMLESLGYEVLEAKNGSSGLTILKKKRHIDMLLSDVVMPGGMSGVELAQKAVALRPQLKVLLATGYSPEEVAQYADGAPSPTIEKPYRKRELAFKVREILDEAG